MKNKVHPEAAEKDSSNNTVALYMMDIQDAREIPEEYCRTRFPDRFTRAGRFRFEEDRLRSLAAGYLYTHVLGVSEKDLRIGEQGKPGIPEGKEFSLSHSGNYAVLAVSDAIVGVDLEMISRRHLDVAERVFTREERDWMQADPENRFVTLWTLKEAASKAVGKGLSIDYRSFSVLPAIAGEAIKMEGISLFGTTRFFEDYALSVMTAKKQDTSWVPVRYRVDSELSLPPSVSNRISVVKE